MAAGIAQGPTPSGFLTFIYGADMFVSNVFGVSPLDFVLQLPLRGAFWATDHNITFMNQEGFSFFQFTSDHLTNLVFTQLTFMAIGGAAHGLGGLRSSLRESAKLGEGAKFFESVATLREARHLSRSLSLYLLGQGKHLLQGVGFFFVLGAISTSFGDASLFAEVALQGLILSSVILGSIHAKRVAVLKQNHPSKESTRYSEHMQAIDELVKVSPWYIGDFIRLRSLLKLGEHQYAMIVALGIATSALQFATIIARVMMEL